MSVKWINENFGSGIKIFAIVRDGQVLEPHASVYCSVIDHLWHIMFHEDRNTANDAFFAHNPQVFATREEAEDALTQFLTDWERFLPFL